MQKQQIQSTNFLTSVKNTAGWDGPYIVYWDGQLQRKNFGWVTFYLSWFVPLSCFSLVVFFCLLCLCLYHVARVQHCLPLLLCLYVCPMSACLFLHCLPLSSASACLAGIISGVCKRLLERRGLPGLELWQVIFTCCTSLIIMIVMRMIRAWWLSWLLWSAWCKSSPLSEKMDGAN